MNHRVGRLLMAAAIVDGIVLSTASDATAQLSAPPSALPAHSAFQEDASPGDRRYFNLPSVNDRPAASSARPAESPTYIVVPSAPTPVFDESDAYATISLPEFEPNSANAFPRQVYPAPPFSWRPSYVTPGTRQGVFQQGLLRATYLPRLDEDGGFGLTSVARQVTLALPPFVYGSPILFTPSYTAHFLSGPGPGDAPPRLHDIEFEFRYLKQVTPRFGIDLAMAPSYFGDFANDSSDAWRITGKAIGSWDWSATVQVVAGGLYLGRDDLPAVPVGGVIWKPTNRWQIDALVPRPRVYYRPFAEGGVEHWVYVGGEFGGNTWAIDRTGDIPDRFTYSDLRLALGWERKVQRGLSGRIEAGWVFNRSIEYESGLPGFDPDNTFMLRAEGSF